MAIFVFLLLLPALAGGEETCDDGHYLVWKDMHDPPGGWECQDDERLRISSYHDPAGLSECSDIQLEPVLRCMEDNISYHEHPPSSGAYRPVAPQYGEYSYLPAQRWLHVLQLGGVAFLYHPCAPLDQIGRLRDVARACLWKHIITPYPLLSPKQPFALVSWGCVYHLTWVSVPEAKLWLQQHALRTKQHMVSSSGAYNKGLLKEANINVTNDVVCPDNIPRPEAPPSSSSSPTELLCANTSTECQHNVIVMDSHGTVAILLVLAGLAATAVVVILSWKIYNRLRNSNHNASRYKSVSKFFPFSYDKVEAGMALPEVGVPKTGAAEREVLLNYSDEEDL